MRCFGAKHIPQVKNEGIQKMTGLSLLFLKRAYDFTNPCIYVRYTYVFFTTECVLYYRVCSLLYDYTSRTHAYMSDMHMYVCILRYVNIHIYICIQKKTGFFFLKLIHILKRTYSKENTF